MTGPFIVPAPYIRGYPDGTPVQPTDAFVIQREGVGTLYVTGLGESEGTTRYLEYVINGNGVAIPTGVAGSGLYVPAATLTGCFLQADQSCTAQIGIWNTPFASYPPTSANTLTPTGYAILTATDHQQQDLTGATGGQGPWNTAIQLGSIWFSVHSNDNAQSITVALVVTTS